MDWKERIVVDPKILVGKPIIKGTRIAVEFVVGLLARGWTTDQVLDEYDHISLLDVQACLAYATEMLRSEKVFLLPPSRASRKTVLHRNKTRTTRNGRVRRTG